jgi:hypothetical protein
MGKWWIALVFFATSAFAQDRGTAYDALRTVSSQLGRGAVSHVISITGVNGDPQPETWRIVLEDSRATAGVQEVEVTNGRMISARTSTRAVVGSAQNATIKTSRLNLDSSGAFQVASHTADKSNAHFATVNYTLRTDERGDPVWIVALLNASGRPVGTIHINCNRGNVVRTEGMFAGATMEDVEVERTEQHTERRIERTGQGDGDEEDADDNRGPLSGPRARVREAFLRAQDEARGMFDRVRRSFDDFINRR